MQTTRGLSILINGLILLPGTQYQMTLFFSVIKECLIFVVPSILINDYFSLNCLHYLIICLKKQQQ